MDKTLVILTPGFAASEADSTCLPAIQQFVLAFKKAYPSLQIIIVAVAYPFSTKPYQWHQCAIVPLRGNRYRKILRPLLWQKIKNKLEKIRRTNHITAILSFWCGEWAMLGTKFGEKYGIRHYCWLQGQDARPGNKYAKHFEYKPQQLIALSQSLAAEFYKNYQARPAHIIPFGAASLPAASTAKTIDLIAVGSLIPLKQYHIFIQVVHQLKKIIPGIKAVLCGKGPQMNALMQMAKVLKVDNNIQFTGEMAHNEVIILMQQSRILLHPSSFEGFSTVCTEALQCSCHVISFCRAMDADIPHWHIAKNETAMYEQALALLQNTGTVYKQVIPYTQQDSIEALWKLIV
jgi:glycosyltransferase involved in cell wall biosynthesis